MSLGASNAVVGNVCGFPLRLCVSDELVFFRDNPAVAGMATDDLCIVLNPYSVLEWQQMGAVALNEAARLIMRSGFIERPQFDLTDWQVDRFSSYGALQDIRETLAARICTGDPSAGIASLEQTSYVSRLLLVVNWDGIDAEVVAFLRKYFPGIG